MCVDILPQTPPRSSTFLTYLPLVPHICIIVIIGLENGLSPIRRQTIIWTNAEYCQFDP